MPDDIQYCMRDVSTPRERIRTMSPQEIMYLHYAASDPETRPILRETPDLNLMYRMLAATGFFYPAGTCTKPVLTPEGAIALSSLRPPREPVVPRSVVVFLSLLVVAFAVIIGSVVWPHRDSFLPSSPSTTPVVTSTVRPSSTPAPTALPAWANTLYSAKAPTKITYIGNRKTKKFHLSTCSSVDQMDDKNKVTFKSRQAAIDAGYDRCQRCHP